jgi:hypothetical protein
MGAMPPRDGGIVSSGEELWPNARRNPVGPPPPKDAKDHGCGLAFQAFRGCGGKDLLHLLGEVVEVMAAPGPPLCYSPPPSCACTSLSWSKIQSSSSSPTDCPGRHANASGSTWGRTVRVNCSRARARMAYTPNLVTILFTSVRIEADCAGWP